jgi:hypothetical protein
MAAETPDTPDRDEQDEAEVFDESKVDDKAEFKTFEEMPDVFDATTALGDAREMRAQDADELDPDALDEEDLEDDEDVDDALDDDFEDEEEDDDLGDEDPDEEDAVDRLARDEANVEAMGDIDDAGDLEDAEADAFEADMLSDADLQDLGYEERPPARPKESRAIHPDDLPTEAHPHQDELLDEGVEETFPASDPVSVKHIT